MSYALHEQLELHEIAVLKTVALTKVKTMRMLVSCEELQAIMSYETDAMTRQLEEIGALLVHMAP
ncbi:hypothetical protein SFC15_18895 [Shouchella clausii]